MKTIFNDKVVWITGASSGIGEALVNEFSSAGAKVILSARNERKLHEVKSACMNDENLFVLPMDVSNNDHIDYCVQSAAARWGRIDYMIHNAGIVARDFAEFTDVDVYRKIMETNFFGTVALTKCLIPFMKTQGGGHFTVLSSLSGKYGIPKLSAYSASKHALHGFFESLRSEIYPHNIRITMVIPGVIKTDIVANGIDGAGSAGTKNLSINVNGINPAICAQKILAGIRKEKQEVLIGGMETMSVYIKRFFPALFSKIIRNHPVRRLKPFVSH
jgi:dehydrogenase/reductase SDR family protein 7B